MWKLSTPFPFGVGDNCYLNPDFMITCNDYTKPPEPSLQDTKAVVSEISVDGQLNVLMPTSQICYDENNNETLGLEWSIFLPSYFTFSKSRNKFTVTGCDSSGNLRVYRDDGKPYSIGCTTLCNRSDEVIYNSCSGSGCCQIEIPDGLYEANISVDRFDDHLNVSGFSPCTYAFLVEEDKFNFSPHHLKNTRKRVEFPVVLDWSVKEEQTSAAVACKANAEKHVEENIQGFRCKCKRGYEGNPYLGCTGTRTTVMVTLMGSSWIYLVLKDKRKLKQKQRFFRENGGFILQEKLFGREGSSGFKIFTALKLEKATKNYDKDMIIGKGGFGIVYKGILSDKTEIAIKKCKNAEHIQIEQFVNVLIILSQINHRNVVKLLGCCLEMQAPSLVYEFIPNGALYEHIHQKARPSSIFPWEICLKVVAEAATTLNYLHFEASVPIIHRDVKTANILLNGKG